jgi:hypothetical protein
MVLHLFRDGHSDVFAFTIDATGNNLPAALYSWRFMETLPDPIQFAFGEANFGDVDQSIAAMGFYLFEADYIEGHLCGA